jgi:hypothetical protein
VFTWPLVQGAASFSIDYNFNGGGWMTGFTNQNTTTYTIPGCSPAPACPTHGTVVNVRVSATNIAGTSTYGTSSITVPRWTNFVLQNNWIDYSTSNWATAAYTKTTGGLVVLKGLIKSGTAGTTVATLPVGYRPAQNLLFQSLASSANARIDVLTNGNVNIVTGSGDLSLEAVRFMPGGNTFTNVTPYFNSWGTYGDANYAIPSQYLIDGSGRVNYQAMISGGGTADNTITSVLPVGARPSQYEHLTAQAGGVYSQFGIGAEGNVYSKGGSNAWFSLHTIFYPASRGNGTTCTTQWCTLTLQNSWAAYPGYSTPQYTKGSDGLVTIKGLLNPGSTTADVVMATLPAGYRPAQRLLVPTHTSTGGGRFDIDASGNIRYEWGSNGWFTFNFFTFMAEQ